MIDVKKLAKELPPMEHEFEIEEVGNITGLTFSGKFRCKIPNLKDQSLIAKHKAMLDGGFDLDLQTHNFHHMIAYLRYTLIEPNEKRKIEAGYPEWWSKNDLGYDLYDVNVVEKVYKNVLDFEKSWLSQVWGSEKEEDAEEASSKDK